MEAFAEVYLFLPQQSKQPQALSLKPEEFDPNQFETGAKHRLDLTFEAGGHALRLPVLLARGAKPGKTLVATAGVHGDEYEGVRAIIEVFESLDPSSMSGDFLAVPVVNEAAHWNLTRTSPLDDLNLARVFPGKVDGRPTEAIAWHLDQQIISRADLYIDMHSAGVKWLMPTLIGFHTPDEEARKAAFAFGAKVVWEHPSIAPGRTVSAAAARGVPALYTEARGAGRIDKNDLLVYKNGLVNLIQYLEILPGKFEVGEPEHVLYGDGNIDQSVSAAQAGFLIPAVELLEEVSQGQKLGTLLDLHGCEVESYYAPCAGLVVLIHSCPKTAPGEPVFLVTGTR